MCEALQNDDTQKTISRSSGIIVRGFVVGGGQRGFSEELDRIVMQEAEFLRDHFHSNVTIRYNSDRLSGGAWLVDAPVDTFGANSSIGLGASLVNRKLRDMLLEETMKLSLRQLQQMRYEADEIRFSTCIDLKKTNHSVPSDSKYILLNSEYRDFVTLDEAIAYLVGHVSGLKAKK